MAAETFGESELAVSGTILMWAGTLANIPDGWFLCDGNNGTPNLLDQLPKQVPDGTTDPGATGGTDSFTLSTSQLPGHNHGGSTSSNGQSRHSYDYNFEGIDSGDNQYEPDPNGDSTASTESAGGHGHTGSLANAGGGGSIDNRPAFYRVAYIMKS